MRTSIILNIAAMITVMVIGAVVAQGDTIYGLAADAEVSSSGGINASGGDFRVGSSGGTGLAGVTVFALPNLDAGYEFTSADFRIRLDGTTGTPSYNADAYGLGYRTSSTVLTTDYYRGVLDTTDATLIQDNYVVSGESNGTKHSNDTN